MAPKIVYAGAICLAALQTTQAFLIPSSFTFPGLEKENSAQDGKTSKDVVNALPMPTEDVREKMKNLHLGVSRPFPFTIPSGNDVDEANQKAKHHFKSICKKLKHDASKWGNKAEEQVEGLDKEILDWWRSNVPSKAKEFKKNLKHLESNAQQKANDVMSDIKKINWSGVQMAKPEHSDVKDKLEEWKSEVEGIDWSDVEEHFEDWKSDIEDIDWSDVEEHLEDWKSEIEDIDWSDVKENLEDWKSEIEDIDWTELVPLDVKGDVDDDEEEDEGPFKGKYVLEKLPHLPSEVQDDVESFTMWMYPANEGHGDDDHTMYIELTNEQTGERIWESISLSHLEDDDNDDDFKDLIDFANYRTKDSDLSDADMDAPGIWGHEHLPHIHDLDISPEWQDKMRHSSHSHRCMRSKFRRFMRSVVSGLRAFVTGFLIPVLIGVAAGMAASLFGMLVGTLCGWLWVKIFRGGRRSDDQAEFVEYTFAGDGLGEKDTLLTVEAVESDEDAPPVYVEKE